MANVYTTFAQAQVDAGLNGAERPTLPSNGGNLHCVNVSKTSYTAATADPLYLVKLPKGSRFGVYIAYMYYYALFQKIMRTPSSEVFSARIRISNRKKYRLFASSFLRHALNLL